MSWHRADSNDSRQEVRGAQGAWRDWSTVLKGYAGAAVPRLQKLMEDAAMAAAAIPNATDPGGRRSGSVGTALLGGSRGLQGCSSQHRVPGRSRSLELSSQGN